MNTVTTDANGLITVLLTTAPDLGPANGKSISLVPVDATNAALLAASIGGTQVGVFFPCLTSGTTGIDKKYLPGSCKN